MGQTVYVYDTVRETEQSSQMEGGLTAEDMVLWMQLLHEFGVDWLEGPWPVPGAKGRDEQKSRRAKAKEFYDLIKQTEFCDKVVVFGSTMEKQVVLPENSQLLQSLVATGLNNFCIFGKGWKSQVQKVLKTSLSNNLRMVRESVAFLKSKGGQVFFDVEHFFQGYESDNHVNYEDRYAIKVIQAARQGGADVIILCDTNGKMLPKQVRRILTEIAPVLADIPWGVHFHNDKELAVANTLEAIDQGATYPQVTTLGHGERNGMTSLTSLLPTLILEMGMKCNGIDRSRLEKLTELARGTSLILNKDISAHAAYVGMSAFNHKAGTHWKDPELQEHIQPSKVGNKRFRQISGLIGPNGVSQVIKDCGLKLKKKDPVIMKVLEKIQELESNGIYLGSANGTLALLTLRLTGKYQRPFQVEFIHPSSNLEFDLEKDEEVYAHSSRADIEISLPDDPQPIREWERGVEGPVDAVNKVLQKSLGKIYPEILEVKLIDYRVRILKQNGKGTASKVRVTIVAQTPFGVFETFWISSNILLASSKALLALYELVVLLAKRKKK